MAFDVGDRQSAEAFERALIAKEMFRETPVAFGYGQGVQKYPSPEFNSRFTPNGVIGGLQGEFGAVTNDKKNKPAQDTLAKWTSQWSSGPFGPGLLAPPEEEPTNA